METLTPNRSQIIEVEVKGKKILVKEYETSDRVRVLEAFDNLQLTTKGRETIRSRFGCFLSKKSFEGILNETNSKRILLFDENQNLLGWGEYFVREDDSKRADLSRLILNTYQNRGLGTLLIDLLIEKCRLEDREVLTMESLTQGDNHLAIKSLEKARKKYGGEMIWEAQTEFYYQPRYIFPIRSLE